MRWVLGVFYSIAYGIGYIVGPFVPLFFLVWAGAWLAGAPETAHFAWNGFLGGVALFASAAVVCCMSTLPYARKAQDPG